MGEEVLLRKSIHLANFTPFMNQASFLQLTSKLNAAHHCHGPFMTFDKNVINNSSSPIDCTLESQMPHWIGLEYLGLWAPL